MSTYKAVVILLLAAVAWAGVGTLLQQAPATAATAKNPLEHDETARRAGAKLYARDCAPCHGKGREGVGKGPSLQRPEVYRAAPGALFWVLRNGSAHRDMPSFAHLPELQRWQIIEFLRNPGEVKRVR